VEDYRLARKKGLIVRTSLNINKKVKIRTLDQISELNSLLSFFYDGGLEAIIDIGSLQDDQGRYLDSEEIISAL
jgi:hypothetical protein